MWGYGDVPLFRGTLFLNSAELSVSVFECVRSYRYLLKKHAESWELFWKSVAEIAKICESCSMILLHFEEISLHFGNIGKVFVLFAELWAAFCQICADLWVLNLNQYVTFPYKIRLS